LLLNVVVQEQRRIAMLESELSDANAKVTGFSTRYLSILVNQSKLERLSYVGKVDQRAGQLRLLHVTNS